MGGGVVAEAVEPPDTGGTMDEDEENAAVELGMDDASAPGCGEGRNSASNASCCCCCPSMFMTGSTVADALAADTAAEVEAVDTVAAVVVVGAADI